jgi:thiol-disulfide isomerase/thioredoxin
MKSVVQLALVCGMSLAVLAIVSVNARGAQPMRYKFQPGQELAYQGDWDIQYEGKRTLSTNLATFWVTRQNRDGSWRLVELQTERSGEPKGDATKVDVFDMSDDGRVVSRQAGALPPGQPFIRLPETVAGGQGGWEFSLNEAAEESCRIIATPRQPDGTFVIEAIRKGIFHDIYQITSSRTIYFDAGRGWIERIEGTQGREWGYHSVGTNHERLTSVKMKDAGWMRCLEAEAELLTDARGKAEEAAKAVAAGAPKQPERDRAFQALQSARNKATLPMIQEALRKELGELDDSINWATQEAADAMLNKRSPSWQTTDLDGQPRASGDYRGKVVALDFWFRGCAGCLQAMPQIKALAEQFQGRPVVILGMNTDEKVEDAKFVQEKLGLNYPTLRGKGIADQYDVHAFPTFVLIDRNGVVRARHVGYSPALFDEMTKTIEASLAEASPSARK